MTQTAPPKVIIDQRETHSPVPKAHMVECLSECACGGCYLCTRPGSGI